MCIYSCGVRNNNILFFNLRDRNILCIFLLHRVCILHFVCCSVFILSQCFFFSMLLVGHIGWKLHKFSFIAIYMGNIAANLFIQDKYLKYFICTKNYYRLKIPQRWTGSKLSLEVNGWKEVPQVVIVHLLVLSL